MAVICDPKPLLAASKCFSCLTPVQMQQVQTYLLCQLLNSLASGGASGVTCGTSNPTTPPNGPCGVYVKQNGVQSGIWVWDGTQWQQLI